MNSPFSRRATSGLIAFASSSTSTCRASTIRRCRIPRQTRTLTTTQRHFQQPSTPNELSPTPASEVDTSRSLTEGLADPPPLLDENEKQVDWTRSFHGLSAAPFSPEQSEILQQRLDFADIEIKPDGIVYLPEIKYRRILNRAFGPGGWGLAPRGETIVTGKVVTREYGLVASGRLISIARGEQNYFDPDGIPTATEGCKSNALMRCCKDLGIASELWDPRFIKKFMTEMSKECMVEHAVTKKRRKHWMRKDDELKWPLSEVSMGAAKPTTGGGSGVKPAGDIVKKTWSQGQAKAASTKPAAPAASAKPAAPAAGAGAVKK